MPSQKVPTEENFCTAAFLAPVILIGKASIGLMFNRLNLMLLSDNKDLQIQY